LAKTRDQKFSSQVSSIWLTFYCNAVEKEVLA